jgi:ubiquinone/menaquinone biosynthesis C-methylase UbiE
MTVRSRLMSIYRMLARVITPTLQFSQYRYQAVLEQSVAHDIDWLDLGCGHQLLPEWRFQQELALVAQCRRIVGVDEHLPSLQRHRSIRELVNASITHLPFRDGSFDLVTANMVVEHLQDPQIQFHEICRVLRPGGVFIMHTPNSAGYLTILARLVPEFLKAKLVYLLQGRKEEDVFPAFYRANSRSAIARLAQASGFEVAEMQMLVSSANLAMVAPLVVFELIWIRLLMSAALEGYRPYLIARLRKPPERAPLGSQQTSGQLAGANAI